MMEPDFRLRNNVIRNPEGKIKFKRLKADGYEHYHVGLWLESTDPENMRNVERVEYELHSSFRNPNRASENRRNDFSITFWSWGTFEVKAKVFLLSGGPPIALKHKLDLGLTKTDEYIDVS